MCREPRVEEQDCVASGKALAKKHEESESSLHRPHCRNDAPRWDVDVKECLEEPAPVLFQSRDAGNVGILGGYAFEKGSPFGLDSHLRCRKAGIPHFEMHERVAEVALQTACQC